MSELNLIRYTNKKYKGCRPHTPNIRIISTGAMSISEEFIKMANITDKDTVEFLQNSENPKDWYIAKSNNGFTLKKHISGNRAYYLLNNSKIVKKILRSLENDEYLHSIGLIINSSFIKVDDMTLYQIDTKTIYDSNWKPESNINTNVKSPEISDDVIQEWIKTKYRKGEIRDVFKMLKFHNLFT